MRRHCRYEKHLAVYRGLDPAERASIDAHLRQCSSCSTRLAGFEWVDQSLKALPELRLPARLQQPWASQQSARQVTLPDRRRRGGFGFVVGRILLPASLVIGLVIGVWLLLASLTGDGSKVVATPTLTLTPTATAVALLGETDEAALHIGPGEMPLPHAALHPVPQPTLIVAQVGAGSAPDTP